ncbi:TonB-dependent receptor plug domain-containing protein [Roseateles oligotrophus]|uniref:TonB-dependent receptor n=1 Tax=Roseateles oligotrophus TaxID=1769250 RepID=A0ABT2YKB4_9BURK|nr:TonB-dependent receptor [Roseateles oligotrophus]MCV2370499.1 TonB-dependent receptor [Roseateles oligotrophus]
MAQSPGVYELSLEDLGRETISQAGTLTQVSRRNAPISVNYIERWMIENSGARRLEDLLVIFVPSFNWTRHPSLPPRFELRGIQSDINDKTLLLVNGKQMNNRLLLGVDTEIGLPMLDDIERIEVVNGPASAVYGPGAINGIINITTLKSSPGGQPRLHLRAGAIENFTSAELQHSWKLGGGDLYAYYGIDKYRGSDQADSPLQSSAAWTSINKARQSTAGEPVVFAIPNDNAAYEGKPRHKLHLQYSSDDWETWLRYSRGGTVTDMASDRTYINNPARYLATSRQSTQLSLQSRYRWKPTQEWTVDATAAADQTDGYRLFEPYDTGERKYNAKLLASWIGGPHQLAMGAEVERMEYRFAIGTPLPAATHWKSHSHSLMFEHQWNINPDWLSFVSLRQDIQPNTKAAVSPRAALVHHLNDSNTLKASYTQSVRRPSAFDTHTNDLRGGPPAHNEDIKTADLRWDLVHAPGWDSAFNLYASTQNLIAYNFAINSYEPLGRIRFWGAEASSSWQRAGSVFRVSQSYVKLRDMQLARPNIAQTFTAQPYGYGNDFANSPNSITKLSLQHELSGGLTLTGSAQKLWHFQGAEDYAAYNRAVLGNNLRFTNTDGSKDAFSGAFFLNAGLIYKHSAQLRLDLNAYNMLGWKDPKYNSRNVQSRMGMWRAEAPALALALSYSM